jgi:hypothetical protein
MTKALAMTDLFNDSLLYVKRTLQLTKTGANVISFFQIYYSRSSVCHNDQGLARVTLAHTAHLQETSQCAHLFLETVMDKSSANIVFMISLK